MRIKHHHVFTRTRRYHRHGSIALAVLIVFSFVATYSNIPPIDVYAESGSSSVYADGDFGPNNFANLGGNGGASCAGGTHCDYIDESGESAYLNTGVNMDATTAEEEFTFANPAVSGTLLSVDSIDVVVRGYTAACNGSGGTPCDSFNVRIFVDGAYNGTTNSTGALTLSPANYTLSWTGLNASTADDLRVEVVRVAEGGGSGSARDDDVYLYDIRVDVNYTFIPAPPMLTQEAFVWENDDGRVADSGNPSNITTSATGIGWSNISNLYSLDDAYTSIGSVDCTTLPVIKAEGFDFNIPSTAQIDGITVGTRRYSTDGVGTGDRTRDNEVYLMKNGTVVGSNYADTATNWPDENALSILRSKSYGGPSNLWGTTWSPSDINTIGVSFQPRVVAGTCSGATSYVDHFQITVYWSITGIDATVQSGSSFSSAVTMDNVRQGERLNLRMHLKNTGEGAITADDELALFYDRNDGIWTRVSSSAPKTADGTGCANANWTCTEVIDAGGAFTEIATNPISGKPWFLYNNRLARYVGSGGNGCTSDAWSCEAIYSNALVESSLTFTPNGVPWISFHDFSTTSLIVATYVGSGGSGCLISSWDCTTIQSTDNTGHLTSIAIDQSGNPWVSYWHNTAGDLRVARYVGSGGSGCDSTAWTCENVDTASSVGVYSSLKFDSSGTAWVSYIDQTSNDLKLATYVGSGGSGCAVSTWTCSVIDSAATADGYTELSFDSSGEAWIAYTDRPNNDVKIAKYVGSGGTGCATTAWRCNVVVDMAHGLSAQYLDMAIGPDNTPWVSYRYGSSNQDQYIARYVGSSGTGCISAEWTCELVQSTNQSGMHNTITIDGSGVPWIVHRDSSNNDVWVATINRSSEIVITNSQTQSSGENLVASRSDMTSATDTTNRDDADCLTASSWNNGVYFGSEIGTGLSLPAGDVTSQCAEIMWTIDTSQATPGETYRFVVATKDALDPSKGVWRGPIQIDEYPAITIASDFEQSTRYSKTLIESDANGCVDDATWSCTTLGLGGGIDGVAVDANNNPWVVATDTLTFDRDIHVAHRTPGSGTGCTDSDWTCHTVDTEGNIDNDVGIAIAPNGEAYIAYATSSNNVKVAKYVGTGGDCVDTAWECTTIDSSLTTPTDVSIAISSTGAVSVVYADTGSNQDLHIAEYVGSGGNCTSSAWSCTVVDGTGTVGNGLHAKYDNNDILHITYSDVTNGRLKMAKYIGSGGSCGSTGGSAAWQCTVIDGTDDVGESFIAFDSSNNAWISYNPLSQTDLYVARYVGGGTGDCATSFSGDSNDWDCEVVDSIGSVGARSSIAFDSSGTAYVSYAYGTSDAAYATFVGSGGSCTGAGSPVWDCDVLPKDDVFGWPYAKVLVDNSGHVVFAVSNASSGNVRIVKPNLPLDWLGNTLSSRTIPSGDYQYVLTNGRSPFSETGVNCSGNSAFAGYCGLNSDNGDYDSLVARSADEMPLYGLATKNPNNTVLPKIQWIGNTNLAPSTASTAGDIVIEVYRFGTTNAWEEVARDNSSTNCSTANCVLSGIPSGTVSEYFETINGEYWIYYRVYQEIDGTTTINFKVDGLKVLTTAQELGGGGFFRDGVELPLNQRR